MNKEVIWSTILDEGMPLTVKLRFDSYERDFMSILLDVEKEIKSTQTDKNIKSEFFNPFAFLTALFNNTFTLEINHEAPSDYKHLNSQEKDVLQMEIIKHNKPINQLYQDMKISESNNPAFMENSENFIWDMKSLYSNLKDSNKPKENYENFSSLNAENSKSPKTSFYHSVNITIEEGQDKDNKVYIFSEKSPNKVITEKQIENFKGELKERSEGVAYQDHLQREDAVKFYYEEVKTEEIKRDSMAKIYEPKHLKVNFEEANIRLNLFGDKIRLYINLDGDVYREPMTFEIQKLVQSLQNLGLNLEVLKLNGNLLYSSDNRYSDNKHGNKRDEKDRSYADHIDNEISLLHKEKRHFNTYL